MGVRLNTKYLAGFAREQEFEEIFPQVKVANDLLHSKTGAGNDYLGWLELPSNYDKLEFARIKQAAAKIRNDSDVLVVIGIGGSYLGARAVIEAVNSAQHNIIRTGAPQIYFAGNSVSPSALCDMLDILQNREFSINMISKSGTTTEPAVAFRVLKKALEDKYGAEKAKERIYVTTDKSRGTLKALATEEEYETFVVPDDVGGRYSVLTAVGLLPIAVSGVNIDELLAGAADAQTSLALCELGNDCYRYAAARNILARKGRAIEVLASFEPDFTMMNEWYKQLFGESEGKDQKGIFPASVVYTTDLHSMGQFMQDGARIMFETVLDIKKPRRDITIERIAEDIDGLNFLAGQSVGHINRMAMQGTILAHADGGVPVMVLQADSQSAYDMGYLIYFFEKACAISGYLLSVNPFNQPGVESYKKNMFALLGKPGFEEMQAALQARLG